MSEAYTPIVNQLHGLLTGVEQYLFPGFEFHHRNSSIAGGADTPLNGQFLCTYCHHKTNSFGANLTRWLGDFLHDFLGFGEVGDNALVVGYVVASEFAAFAVFEPLLRGLVATDVKLPS